MCVFFNFVQFSIVYAPPHCFYIYLVQCVGEPANLLHKTASFLFSNTLIHTEQKHENIAPPFLRELCTFIYVNWLTRVGQNSSSSG